MPLTQSGHLRHALTHSVSTCYTKLQQIQLLGIICNCLVEIVRRMLNGLLRSTLRKVMVRFAWTRPWKRGCAISSPCPFPCIQLQEGHGRGLSGSPCWAGIPGHASGSRRSHCGVTWIFRVLKNGLRPGITLVPLVAVPPPKLIPMIMLATLAEPGWSGRLRAGSGRWRAGCGRPRALRSAPSQ